MGSLSGEGTKTVGGATWYYRASKTFPRSAMNIESGLSVVRV
jgi:hypothetical protein